MGRVAQKRLVRRLDLEKALFQVEPHPSPKAYLEQYTIPASVAAEVLFTAAYIHDDVDEKFVADLGCGTGRLAIGAVILGAAETVGVDIDREAVKVAKRNAEKLGVKEKTNWIAGGIEVLNGIFQTVLQNPPFGVQTRSADRKFLLKALELAPRVYSLHKSGESNRAFIKRFIEGHGGKVTGIFPMKFNIPKLFKFHTKRKHEVEVDLYRIVRA
jgi:putative methylase